jgi:hypothetical protein
MLPSVILCISAHVRINVSEEHILSIVKVTRVDELATTLAVTSKRSTPCATETSVYTRATLRNIPKDRFLSTVIVMCKHKITFILSRIPGMCGAVV